ncbi:MAG: hypothetical protein JOS17DRAFT_763667 [Linnemannia elongata]|nr:MAG: hypothetical protein JOS17DRAFT_763667 [Linnemannia elongata]
MPSSSFWFLALVGTPIIAYSSLKDYTFTYIIVLLTTQLLLSCCSGCSDSSDSSDTYPHYQVTPYQASLYQGTQYHVPSPIKSAVTSLTPTYDASYNNPEPPRHVSTILRYNPAYSPTPSEYDDDDFFTGHDDFFTRHDDIYSRYNDSYSRYEVPTPTYNIPKPSPRPSSVYEQQLELPTYCGQDLHEHVVRHAVDRYQYHRGLSGAPSSSYVIRDETRCVLGWFTCKYQYCPALYRRNQFSVQRTWRSGSICVRVLVNYNDHYQTIIHAQQCNSCNNFVKPDIDEDVYAKRIVSALDLWTGRRKREAPNTDFVKTRPHDCARCYGCQTGICPRRE